MRFMGLAAPSDLDLDQNSCRIGGEMRSLFSSALVLCCTVGCASTNVTAFKDPDFAAKQYRHVAAFVVGGSLVIRQDMELRLCAEIAPTTCTPGLTVLPPTRQYTPAESNQIIGASGSDAVLIVSIGADNSQSAIIGYQTFSTAQANGTATTTGTVSTYGNTSTYQGVTQGNATATGQSTTVPIMYFSRVAAGTVALLDAATGKTAWSGEVQTHGRGLLATRDSAFESSSTKEIIGQLRAAGLIAKR
jgi:hypothetical protein